MKKQHIILFAIFFVGLLLRFYQLGEVPYGFHRDEAFLGYNAYSLLKTGKDMSGVSFPIHLESFIYSPGGYSYLSIPFIAIFNLNASSTRLASALFGSLSIILIFILGQKLFAFSKFNTIIAFFSAVLLAISPWHINLSRTATENIVVLFFLLLGIILFIEWSKNTKWVFLIASFICFLITLTLYQAPRAFLPFFIPLIILVFCSLKQKKQFFISFIIFVTFIIFPIFLILFSNQLSLRIRTVSIFASPNVSLTIDEQIREEGIQGINALQTRIFHNKLIGFSGQFLGNYFSHFSYSFLFTDAGYPERYRVPMGSLVYVGLFPFLLLGTLFLLQKNKKMAVFIFGWILFTPIGSALAFDDVPNLQRTIIMLPPICFVASLGIIEAWFFFKKRKIIQVGLSMIIGTILLYQSVFYLRQYFIHYSLYRPWYRHDGYRELVGKVSNYREKYQKIVITDRESAPTIFFLFYQKYNPSIFHRQTAKSTLRDFDRISFGIYEFSQEECPLRIEKDGTLTSKQDTLYVNSALCKLDDRISLLDTVKRKDDSKVFYIVDKK